MVRQLTSHGTVRKIFTATNVIVNSPTSIACDFDLTGAAPGFRNIFVTNHDGQSGQLIEGFTVEGEAHGDLDYDGIPDSVDPETIVNASALLNAGEYTFLNLIITNNASVTVDSNCIFARL